MTTKVKIAIFCLIASLVCSCLASFLDGLYEDGMDIVYWDVIWFGIIVWMIYDLVKKNNIIVSLYAVIPVCVGFTIYDYIEYGLRAAFTGYILEIIFLLLSVYAIKRVDGSYWVSREVAK